MVAGHHSALSLRFQRAFDAWFQPILALVYCLLHLKKGLLWVLKLEKYVEPCYPPLWMLTVPEFRVSSIIGELEVTTAILLSVIMIAIKVRTQFKSNVNHTLTYLQYQGAFSWRYGPWVLGIDWQPGYHGYLSPLKCISSGHQAHANIIDWRSQEFFSMTPPPLPPTGAMYAVAFSMVSIYRRSPSA